MNKIICFILFPIWFLPVFSQETCNYLNTAPATVAGSGNSLTDSDVTVLRENRGVVGIVYNQTAYGTFIRQIILGSPAQLAGLKQADQLTQIDNVKIFAARLGDGKKPSLSNGGSKKSLSEVMALTWGKPDTTIKLTFNRYPEWKESPKKEGIYALGNPSSVTVTLSRVGIRSLVAQAPLSAGKSEVPTRWKTIIVPFSSYPRR